MSRSYAQFETAIWDSEDWCDLSRDEQWLYFLVASQRNISAAGVLPVWIPRWVAMSRGATEQDILDILTGLEKRRYIAFDRLTGELLIRTFVKADKGYPNSKRRPVILRAAAEVRSMALRQVLAAEFARLGLPIDGLRVSAGEGPSDVPSDRTSMAHTADADGTSRSDGVVGCTGSALEPQSSTPTPQPPPTAMPDTADELDDPVPALVAEVREIRPEWSPLAIADVLADPDVRTRPWAVVAAALVLVARDPQSKVPGRLRASGPWWSDAAARAAPNRQRDPPCGACDPATRLIETYDEATARHLPARCPTCHPLYEQTSARTD